ncbi:archaea-specific SMC-related protein [uncultured Halorubrum sp.]|uniref:archaea-specific SMC-related protein n=1 Tax=uncultured Halorubrum sp. TaxID=399555 RepID=UPI00260FC3C3|nr:archaea-specific SMC-related protein [uncultured Halorubrum sp.]
MEIEQVTDHDATLRAENIGGIEETTVSFTPGVTVLVGRNATNRTSFLQAVMAALGSENVAVKGDADEAAVELSIGDETYTRQFRRRGDGIASSGEPYLDDPDPADLFAFLLESNEARRAVAANADLREVIMRPVDVDDIRAEIDGLVERRDALVSELDELDSLKRKLPPLEEKRRDLRSQIEDKKAELRAKQDELAAADATVDESRDEASELDEKLDELGSKRSALDDARYELETEQESLEAITRDQRELERELADLPDVPDGRIDEIESEIRQLRDEKQRVTSRVNELQGVIGFNEEMLDDAESAAFDDLGDADDDDVTGQLLAADDVTCWTCGSSVEREQIEATLDQLRDRSQTAVGRAKDLEDEIAELEAEKRDYEQSRRERDRLEDRLSAIEREQGEIEARIEDLRERRETLIDEIEAIQAEVEELEDDDASAVLDLHKAVNELEYELGKLENDLERVDSNVTEIEDRLADQDEIEREREAVSDEIESLRTKIERIEESAVEQFNDHMDTVLALLDYDNLDRIWIERVQRDVREGRRTVTKTVFELHVIRTSASGTAYEDTVDHLSESEREVTGLVFALAGYLAHEVYEALPFVVLDSLEAIDSERIATLVEYLDDYTGYLLVALLPEDAAALSDEYERITDI